MAVANTVIKKLFDDLVEKYSKRTERLFVTAQNSVSKQLKQLNEGKFANLPLPEEAIAPLREFVTKKPKDLVPAGTSVSELLAPWKGDPLFQRQLEALQEQERKFNRLLTNCAKQETFTLEQISSHFPDYAMPHLREYFAKKYKKKALEEEQDIKVAKEVIDVLETKMDAMVKEMEGTHRRAEEIAERMDKEAAVVEYQLEQFMHGNTEASIILAKEPGWTIEYEYENIWKRYHNLDRVYSARKRFVD